MVGFQEQSPHTPAIWVRGRQLAELAEELPEKFFGLPPETMDAAGGGEFAEQLMRKPCGTVVVVQLRYKFKNGV